MTEGNDSAYGFVDNRSSDYVDNEVRYGLSKREYFAAMAMQGMVSKTNDYNYARAIAEVAVKYADELINELNKSQ
jgi:hypothetical protein